MSVHKCPALGCKRRIDNRFFACQTHWSALSLKARQAILNTYVPGQGMATWTLAYEVAALKAQAEMNAWKSPLYPGGPPEG